MLFCCTLQMVELETSWEALSFCRSPVTNDWAALEIWLKIQGVYFTHELQDLSLFLPESRPLTNQDVVVSNQYFQLSKLCCKQNRCNFFFSQIDYPNYSLYYMKPKEKMKCTNSWPPASCSSIIRNYKLMLVVLHCSMGRFMSLCSQCWWNKLN